MANSGDALEPSVRCHITLENTVDDERPLAKNPTAGYARRIRRDLQPVNPGFEFTVRALLIGIGATAVLDLWSILLKRLFGIPSADWGMVGRWFGHFPRGRFVHDSIRAASPVRGEQVIGWSAHYAIGIFYAVLLLAVWGLDWARRPTQRWRMSSPEPWIRSICEASFYRASGGAEIDLVLTFPGHGPWAIEIKRSLDPKPAKGFHSACKDVQPEAQFVVYPGQERFAISKEIEAVSIAALAEEIIAELG